jgi:leucyl-tRNA synthetase
LRTSRGPSDETLTRDATSAVPVQIHGKVRSRITLPADADRAGIESAALADTRVRELLTGRRRRGSWCRGGW